MKSDPKACRERRVDEENCLTFEFTLDLGRAEEPWSPCSSATVGDNVENMSDSELEDDPVARSLASKAFAAQVVGADLGEFDADLIRESLIYRWERAGSPPGAFLRAALLVLDLPARLAQDESSSPVEEFGISREEEIAAARRAGKFLEQIALNFQ